MKDSLRYIFDTNTLISAALFANGKPSRAFRWALKNGIVLLSQRIFEEIDEVIAREKFDDYLSVEERAEFMELLVERSNFVNPTEKVQACRDPNDEIFSAGGKQGGGLYRKRRRRPVSIKSISRYSNHDTSELFRMDSTGRVISKKLKNIRNPVIFIDDQLFKRT
jgi:putative PIN family toxin of toxin-antitoxin system